MKTDRSDGGLILMMGAVLAAATVHAETGFDQHLTGDWAGARTALLERGFSVEAFNTSDAFRTIRGGLSPGYAVSNEFELIVAADLASLRGWPGATLYLHTASSAGRAPVELSGSIHEPSDLVDDKA